LTGATSVVVLFANALGGVLIARLLSPSGKGAVTAIANWAQLSAWICALGFGAAATYFQARRPADGPRLVGTCFVAAAVLGSLGFVTAGFLVGVVFADQDPTLRTLAQVFMLFIYLQVLMDSVMGVLVGALDFTFYNLTRVLAPSLYVLALTGISLTMGLDVERALTASVLAHMVTLGLTLRRAFQRVGIGRPSMAILRSHLSYGLKLQGGQLAGLASYRLDILVMPLVLSTRAVGLYSVAVSVSSMVLSLMGSLSAVVFPVAARAGSAAAPLMITRALRSTLALALVAAAGLFVGAPFLIRMIYGPEFEDGVMALRLLLIGYVFASGASIIVAGLKALNRPVAASIGQLAAIPVTIGGLWLVLRPYGIEGAAVVSTVAFFIQFVVGGAALVRVGGVSASELVSWRGLRRDLLLVRERVRGARRGRRRKH
jgi:O-antigen/teichoic acid export membrane protein